MGWRSALVGERLAVGLPLGRGSLLSVPFCCVGLRLCGYMSVCVSVAVSVFLAIDRSVYLFVHSCIEIHGHKHVCMYI